jgi:NAD+ synthase
VHRHHLKRRTVPLSFDVPATIALITEQIADAVRDLGRRGALVAISGGVDSSVCAGLCAKALGPERVFGLLLPERANSPDATIDGRQVAEALGIEYATVPITDVLQALGCYEQQVAALRRIVPDYQPGWRHKIVRSAPTGGMVILSMEIHDDAGDVRTVRIPADVYREYISAQNMKQRVRKLLEYTWAERLGYAVIGTPNRLEFDQGFFVKSGDGLADIKPIAGLYKSQVFALVRDLGLPEKIATRPPTTDTFTLPQSQEEYFFGHPHERMDLLLWGRDNDLSPAELEAETGIDASVVEAAYGEIDRRRAGAMYLHAGAIVLEAGVGPDPRRILAGAA